MRATIGADFYCSIPQSGQPCTSTLARLPEADREQARDALASFAGWIMSSPDVLPYVNN